MGMNVIMCVRTPKPVDLRRIAWECAATFSVYIDSPRHAWLIHDPRRGIDCLHYDEHEDGLIVVYFAYNRWGQAAGTLEGAFFVTALAAWLERRTGGTVCIGSDGSMEHELTAPFDGDAREAFLQEAKRSVDCDLTSPQRCASCEQPMEMFSSGRNRTRSYRVYWCFVCDEYVVEHWTRHEPESERAYTRAFGKPNIPGDEDV